MQTIGAARSELLTAAEVSPRTKGAGDARTSNASTAVVGSSAGCGSFGTGNSAVLGKGCHTVYEAREIIDPANDDYGIYIQADAR